MSHRLIIRPEAEADITETAVWPYRIFYIVRVMPSLFLQYFMLHDTSDIGNGGYERPAD